ncbi:hypothetical protein JTE90_019068 [Oedothorax gibbosus]|uniref:Uncharacterized protein n=1 Tax=Oedothorax gibbosus TaxID=931172 RepID=A0AAV6UY55_9ARAC|nr:hypothetical protein JTE90_019068 [Oedothorax gibbosus]
MHLKASACVPARCFQCDRDRSHAIKGDIETNIGNQLEVNQMMSVFDCANWGVEHDRINYLESLIHHLVSIKNGLEYFWSFQDCVDWFEIDHRPSSF